MLLLRLVDVGITAAVYGGLAYMTLTLAYIGVHSIGVI